MSDDASSASTTLQSQDRVIRGEIIVQAGVDAIWAAWTTEEGIKSFFAPACNVDLRVNGLYEILFDPDAEAGWRGAEGTRIMAFQPKKMLAFTWNAPPNLTHVRHQLTHVVLRFAELSGGRTQVSMTHDGWGEGGEWDEAFAYFVRAWKDIVLPRLQYRFSVGPVDWDHPPNVALEQ
jgi:uncharacterized protein YndB with AHSA1/START domain